MHAIYNPLTCKVITVETTDQHPWGRVDETGTVFVRAATGERAVGQFPDGSPQEALAYFERKYVDLAGQVTLLEQRAKRGAPATDIARAVKKLQSSVSEANAVGDLESLAGRLTKLDTTIESLTEQQSAQQKAAAEAAVAERAKIVDEIEALAAADPAKTQWKQTTAKLDELFARWQAHQQGAVRVPKGEANELWRRFRAARTTIETNRKAFFAELDSTHKDVRARKTKLIERAEALLDQGVQGIPAYRNLLEEWKNAGRAGKRHDDALWARFKAAGDALFGAKAQLDAEENEEYTANLALKLALLDEAEPILGEKNRELAKQKLLSIQTSWDAIGKVPRDKVKPVEDRLRKVEAAVRKLDEDFWKKNNPETKARAEGLAGQLHAAIAKLEDEVREAEACGDAARVAAAEEALSARRAWLAALG